jgi:Domain of unknown function (DUF4365)
MMGVDVVTKAASMAKPQTERLGVAALEYFFSKNGWLFREQTTHDYGIDAHVEIVVDERPTGKLIALQIKTGTSFFGEQADGAYIFRTDDKHLAYWVGHSMPVVVVLYNPDSKEACWQHVSRQAVETTGKGWKLSIPKVNLFDKPAQSLKAFEALTQPEPYMRRLNRLRVDRHWMDLIDQGFDVRVEFEDWVNKSLSRYQITISNDHEKETWPTLYTPGVSIEEMLAHFFPWADFSLDQEAHEDGARARWEDECYAWRDEETGTIYHTTPFEKWYKPQEGIVSVSEDGETASYSLFLSLNEFGRSFLLMDDYLADPDAPETIGFTLD